MNVPYKSLTAICLTLLFSVSCSEKKSEPENVTQIAIDPIIEIQTKSDPQVRDEIKNMDVAEIEKIVTSYKIALESKKNEFKALENRIKNISIKDALNGETKKIEKEVGKVTSTVNSLKKRLKIYITKLQELNINISKL